MNVSLRQLQIFEAVVRHLSYTRAAEELHLTQPAVSMQVRQLEEELGLPLFEKLGRGIALTEAQREIFAGMDFFISQNKYTPADKEKMIKNGLIDPAIAEAAKKVMEQQGIAAQ